MEPTPAESRALEAAQAAYRQTGYRSKLLIHQWFRVEPETGGAGARFGTIGIPIQGGPSTLVVWYSWLGPADGLTWSEGRCDLRFDPSRPLEWQFFCSWKQDLLSIHQMHQIRRHRLLEKAILSTLGSLGGSREAICHRLQGMRYSPTPSGINQMISNMFSPDYGVTKVEGHWRLNCDARCMQELPLAAPLPANIIRFLTESQVRT